eukprot:m.240113 g.240113  ORF g.240113 m.240113 type:complete len:592 (+) comp33760_c1_seq1:86-1861(+)
MVALNALLFLGALTSAEDLIRSSTSDRNGSEFCFVRGSQKVMLDDTCLSLGSVGQTTLEVQGMRGEAEHIQMVMPSWFLPASPDGTGVLELQFPSLTLQPLPNTNTTSKPASSSLTPNSIPASNIVPALVGFVNCATTTRYSPSGGGWHPDPLFTDMVQPKIRLQSDVTNSIFIRVDIPRTIEPGMYVGTAKASYTGNTTVKALDFSFDINVVVWNTTLPEPEQMYKDFGEIWSFTFNDWTGNDTINSTTQAYLDMMSDHLLPPDSLYKRQPYTEFSVYEYLNATGKQLLNLADISNLDGTYDTDCKKAYTQEYITSTLAMLEPTITKLKASGILDTKQAYVYGYDEQPVSCEKNIRTLFGAVKAKWPFITTAAVLNWEGGLPVDLPVDVWILQYEDYNADNAKAWKAAGKKQFWYHCIEPSGSAYLNTFIERPWVQGRLLYWLAAKEDIDGWLYYATDLWVPSPGKTIQGMQPIANSSLTTYDPANYIWSPRTDIFANGDGQFIYPGGGAWSGKPVGTARLANMRDAVEDQVLFQMVRNAGKEAQLQEAIAKLVRSPTDHTDDANLLETTRRALASLLSQSDDIVLTSTQ